MAAPALCRLRRGVPRSATTAEGIGAAYEAYYTHEPPSQAGARTGGSRVRRALRNGYLNERYGYDLRPAWAARRKTCPSSRRSGRPPTGTCEGLQVDPRAVARARETSLDVREGALEPGAYPAGSFDAVT